MGLRGRTVHPQWQSGAVQISGEETWWFLEPCNHDSEWKSMPWNTIRTSVTNRSLWTIHRAYFQPWVGATFSRGRWLREWGDKCECNMGLDPGTQKDNIQNAPLISSETGWLSSYTTITWFMGDHYNPWKLTGILNLTNDQAWGERSLVDEVLCWPRIFRALSFSMGYGGSQFSPELIPL